MSYVHTSSDVPFLSKTMGQVVDEQAEVHCDEEAFILPFQNIRKTFAEFKEDVDAFGSGLLALGLQRGDRVGMWGTNSYQWLLTQFATAKAGLVMVCVNPGYKANELAFCLETAQIKVLIASEENYTSKSLATLEQISPDLLSLKQKGFNRRLVPAQYTVGSATLRTLRKASGQHSLVRLSILIVRYAATTPAEIAPITVNPGLGQWSNPKFYIKQKPEPERGKPFVNLVATLDAYSKDF